MPAHEQKEPVDNSTSLSTPRSDRSTRSDLASDQEFHRLAEIDPPLPQIAPPNLFPFRRLAPLVRQTAARFFWAYAFYLTAFFHARERDAVSGEPRLLT